MLATNDVKFNKVMTFFEKFLIDNNFNLNEVNFIDDPNFGCFVRSEFHRYKKYEK